MKRYKELSTKEEFMQLEQIDFLAIHWLWAQEYWDGPLSGMVLFDGKKYWAKVFDDSDPDSPDSYRRFVLIILSEAQIAEEEAWHELFRQKVGGRMDFREDGRLDLDAVLHPKELQEEFYEQYKHRMPLDLSQNHCLGWFEIH
jgi:hypothetical protein